MIEVFITSATIATPNYQPRVRRCVSDQRPHYLSTCKLFILAFICTSAKSTSSTYNPASVVASPTNDRITLRPAIYSYLPSSALQPRAHLRLITPLPSLRLRPTTALRFELQCIHTYRHLSEGICKQEYIDIRQVRGRWSETQRRTPCL